MSRVLACATIAAVVLTTASCRRPTRTSTADSPVAGSGTFSIALGLDGRVDGLLNNNRKASAENLVQTADSLKLQGDYEEAAVHYLAALRLDPKHKRGRYQFACDLAQWGHGRLALIELRRLVDEGFWGYELMRTDDDLEPIWQEPEFKSLLAIVQQRYPAEAAKYAGKQVSALPDGAAPAKGWPVVVYLHGMGDGPASYRDEVEAATDHGFAGFAIAGPVVQWEDSYAWPAESVEPTHQSLRKTLDAARDKNLDRSRVYLIGFSQGAIHAAGLVASHPADYAGAIVLSPGGPPGMKALRLGGPARPACVIHGQREHPGNKSEAAACVAAWQRARWPVLQETHPGHHELPEDWDDRFPRLLKWLQANGK